MNMKKNMYSQTDNTKTQKLVLTNMGSMPLEDYLEIRACQYGFSSYEEMKEDGLSIEIPGD